MLAILNIDQTTTAIEKNEVVFKEKIKAGTVVEIVGLDKNNSTSVEIRKPGGGSTAWCKLADLRSVDGVELDLMEEIERIYKMIQNYHQKPTNDEKERLRTEIGKVEKLFVKDFYPILVLWDSLETNADQECHCHFCGSLLHSGSLPSFYLTCDNRDCGARGPFGRTQADAIKKYKSIFKNKEE